MSNTTVQVMCRFNDEFSITLQDRVMDKVTMFLEDSLKWQSQTTYVKQTSKLKNDCFEYSIFLKDVIDTHLHILISYLEEFDNVSYILSQSE